MCFLFLVLHFWKYLQGLFANFINLSLYDKSEF